MQMCHIHSGKLRLAKRTGAAGLALAAVLGLTACGSSGSNASSSGGKTTSSTASASASSDKLAAAKADIAKYEKRPSFTAPGPKFSAKADAGKTVWVVPDISSVPVVQQVEQGLTTALKDAKVNENVETADGTVTQWVSDMDTAISQNASAIVDIGIEPSQISAQVAKAAAAHIPVIYVFSVLGTPTPKNVAGTVPINYNLYAKLLAEKAAVDTNGHAHVAIAYTNQLPQDVPAIKIIKNVFASICPGCSVDATQNIPEAQWATNTTSDARSILTANPQVNVLMPLHDALAEFMVPALRSANKIGQVKIETHDGTPSAVQEIKSGAITSDLGWSNTWVGWATADQALRVLAGKPALTDEKIGNVLFDTTNAGGISGPSSVNSYFGNSYVAGYKTLWGLS